MFWYIVLSGGHGFHGCGIQYALGRVYHFREIGALHNRLNMHIETARIKVTGSPEY